MCVSTQQSAWGTVSALPVGWRALEHSEGVISLALASTLAGGVGPLGVDREVILFWFHAAFYMSYSS